MPVVYRHLGDRSVRTRAGFYFRSTAVPGTQSTCFRGNLVGVMRFDHTYLFSTKVGKVLSRKVSPSSVCCLLPVCLLLMCCFDQISSVGSLSRRDRCLGLTVESQMRTRTRSPSAACIGKFFSYHLDLKQGGVFHFIPRGRGRDCVSNGCLLVFHARHRRDSLSFVRNFLNTKYDIFNLDTYVKYDGC